MGELAPEFKQKIANFDGNNQINTQEKDVIFYVESYARSMPPEYLNKLIDAIKEKLKDKQLSKDQIRIECESAINKLNNDLKETFFEKKLRNVKNIATVFEVNSKLGLPSTNDLDQNGFSDKGLHGFNKERGNFFMTIGEFEGIIKMEHNVKNINSKALANYFLYLHNKGQLKPEILIHKFGSDILFQLGQLWNSGGNPGEDNSLIAKHILEKNGIGYIINVINIFSSPKNFLEKIGTLQNIDEQKTALLFLDKNLNSIKETFKKDLKEKFIKSNPLRIHEADKIIDGLMSELIIHKDIKGLPKIYQIFDEYNRKYKLGLDIKTKTGELQAVQKAEIQRDIAKSHLAISQTRDEKEKKKLQKNLKIEEKRLQEQEVVSKINQKIDSSDIRDLISGEKKMEQVVGELRKKDKDFNKEYVVWQKSAPVAEKTNTESLIVRSNRSNIPFQEIDNGNPHTIQLDSHSENTDTVTIKRHDNLYVIQMGNDPENTTELPKEKVSAYIKSLRFMEKLGLGYFLRNLSQNELSSILALTSKDTETVDNRDGNFDETEKKRILSSFGKILDINGADNINSKDGQKLFQGFFFTHPSIETILTSKNIIQNGSLNTEILKKKLKST